MGLLIVRHKIKDYAKWKPVFEGDAAAPRAAGLSNPRVFRSADDKSELVLLFDSSDTRKAKDFASSPRLKEAMDKAGVTDRPTIFFLDAA